MPRSGADPECMHAQPLAHVLAMNLPRALVAWIAALEIAWGILWVASWGVRWLAHAG